MFKRPLLFAAPLVAIAFTASAADAPDLGRVASPEEVSQRDLIIAPDGENLPEGSGSVAEGAMVYAEKCAACHGANGNDGPMDRLHGGEGTIGTGNPVRTVSSYWPYATTLFDYVRRAMPANAPQSLTDDEVYAVTAYVLSLGGIVDDDAVMDAETLPQVEMPNRDGFVWAEQPGG